MILIAALFLFGPTKLPELAHSLGKAVGEFKKAQWQTEHEIKKPEEPPCETSHLNAGTEKDIKIHNLAVEMGLDVQNKTIEQLVEEIRMKIKSGETLPIRPMKTAGV